MTDRVDDLVVEGRLDRIGPDRAAVERICRQSSLNIEGARREDRAANLGGAYALLWDAIRQAIAAHMLAHGLRANSSPGHHSALITYAECRLGSVLADDDLAMLDRMRRTRNLSEYGARPVAPAVLEADLVIGRRVVQAILGVMLQ